MTGTHELLLQLPGGGSKRFELDKPEVVIGRAVTSDIVVKSDMVSRTHARLECGSEDCTLIDLGSSNGTRVNGHLITRRRLLPGDQILLGDVRLGFDSSPESPGATLTRIDTPADLQASIAGTPLGMRLQDTSHPRIVVKSGGKTWEVSLEAGVAQIGRQSDNEIVINSEAVSRCHARIVRSQDGFVLEDLNSHNGTWIRGEKVTQRKLSDWDTIIIGPACLVFKEASGEEALTVFTPAGAKPRARRPVVVVPGFMGSNLWLGSERIWPSVSRLFTDPGIFRYTGGSGAIEAHGLVDEVVIVPNLIKLQHYGKLIDYLEEAIGYERGADLLEFAYDFRQDVRVSARQMAQAIDAWEPRDPVTIIAHSMGSLVSRYYVEKLGGHRKVERMVLLGGPLQGAPKSLTNLLATVKLLPFGLMGEKLRQLIIGFPSVYQLIPSFPCGKDQQGQPIDWLKDDSWLPASQREHLHTAAAFRAELRHTTSTPTVCIFGYGLKTIAAVNIERGADGACENLSLITSEEGDGTVPESSAVLPGAEIHPVRQYHEALHVDNDVKKRLKVELTR